MKQIIAISLFLSLLSCAHTPQERNISSLSSQQIDDLWVVTSKKKDSLIRSNPQHFWAWMEAYAQGDVGSLLNDQGEVTADPHFFNFADIHHATDAQKNGLALVDVDDSGAAPFILDFVRYALFVKAYTEDNYKNIDSAKLYADLYQFYLKGLSQENLMAPAVLQKVIQKSRKKLEKENQEWVAEYTNENKGYALKKNKLDLKDLSEGPAGTETMANDLKKSLLKNQKVSQIYDSAFTVNDSGSSRGLSRLWFSVQIPDSTRRILECKEFSRPATDYYKKQVAHTERVSRVLKYYADFQTDDSYVVNASAASFWCRPREFKFIKRSDIENLKTDEIKELSVYFSYWLGLKQSLQPHAQDLLKAMQKNKQTIDDISRLLKKYDQHVDVLFLDRRQK